MSGSTATATKYKWIIGNTSNDKSNNFTTYTEVYFPKLDCTTNLVPLDKPIVADTAATDHFTGDNIINQYLNDLIHIINKQQTSQGIHVLLPNNNNIPLTHTCNLNIPGLSTSATKDHIFNELASGSLIPTGKLCDVGYTTDFTKQKLYIFYKRNPIMQGSKKPNKLWTINIQRVNTPSAP